MCNFKNSSVTLGGQSWDRALDTPGEQWVLSRPSKHTDSRHNLYISFYALIAFYCAFLVG